MIDPAMIQQLLGQANTPEQQAQMKHDMSVSLYNEQLHDLATQMFMKNHSLSMKKEDVEELALTCFHHAHYMLQSKNLFVEEVKQSGQV